MQTAYVARITGSFFVNYQLLIVNYFISLYHQ